MKGRQRRIQGLNPGLQRKERLAGDAVERPQLMAGWSVVAAHQEVLTWVPLLHVPAQVKKHTVYEMDRHFGLEHYDHSPLIHSRQVEGSLGVSIQSWSCSRSETEQDRLLPYELTQEGLRQPALSSEAPQRAGSPPWVDPLNTPLVRRILTVEP
jgi:hypothetical protein